MEMAGAPGGLQAEEVVRAALHCFCRSSVVAVLGTSAAADAMSTSNAAASATATNTHATVNLLLHSLPRYTTPPDRPRWTSACQCARLFLWLR